MLAYKKYGRGNLDTSHHEHKEEENNGPRRAYPHLVKAMYNNPIVNKHIIVIDLGLYRKSIVTSSTFCSSKFSCSSELGQEHDEYVLDRE